MMRAFRERTDALKRFRELRRAGTSLSYDVMEAQSREALDLLANASRTLWKIWLSNRERAVKFLEVWKRTYWNEATVEWHWNASPHEMLRLSKLHRDPPRFPLRLFADRTTVFNDRKPRNEHSISHLTCLESIHDRKITGMGLLPNDHVLLCRVFAAPFVSTDGICVAAEDRRGFLFWISVAFAWPPDLVELNRTLLADELFPVGAVFALTISLLDVFAFSWAPQLNCTFSPNVTVPIFDLSNELLRDTDWFEEPCASALQWKQRGNERFAERRFESAVACYSHGIALESTVDLLSNRAAANLKLGEWASALADADAVLARDGAHRKCALRRATALAKLNRHRDAIDAWTRATILNSDSPADKALCTTGAELAAVALRQSMGKFKWRALRLDRLKGVFPPIASFLHPAVHRAPTALVGCALGMFAREFIPRNTLISMEDAIVHSFLTTAVEEPLFLASRRDSMKRSQLEELAEQPHIRARTQQVRNDGDLMRTVVQVHSSAAVTSDVANALYFQASMFNHSCVPNCMHVYGSAGLLVTTVLDVRPGEELFISIVDADAPRRERRAQLEERSGFDCRCARCSAANEPPYQKPPIDIDTVLDNSVDIE